MKTKILIAVGVLLAVLIIIFGIRFFSGAEDTWLCEGGQWVKHGNPASAQPVEPCLDGPAINFNLPKDLNSYLQDIQVQGVEINNLVSSPLQFSGQARGNWFFEASFPVQVTDDKDVVLGQGLAIATGDWMTADFVPFTAKVDFTPGDSINGYVVLNKDNPSGDPDNSFSVKIPVRFVTDEKTKVKIYFGKVKDGVAPNDCSDVVAVDREVPKTVGVARAALEQLLLGLNDQEKQGGYFNSINPGVKILKLEIDNNGVARVDFDETLDRDVAGSCRVTAIRAQITETLKQFPTVKSVVISVNGRVDDILQP